MAAAKAAPKAAAKAPVAHSTFEGTQYEFAEGLSASVPEIAGLIKTAAAQGWDTTRFADALQATAWWKTNSDSARSAIALKASDPAQYNQQVAQAKAHISAMALQLGVKLTPAQLSAQVTADVFQGLDDSALQQNLAGMYKTGAGTGNGTSADVAQNLRQLAASYGIPVTQSWIDNFTHVALTTGDTTLTQATRSLIATAKSTYPSLATQLDSGMTVDQIAEPYKAAMSQTLEIPETAIKLTDPTIQKALSNPQPTAPSGTGGSGTGASNPAKPTAAPGATVMPLYQFNDTLRADPRWGKTDNAKQTAYSLVAGLGKEFGLAT